MNTPGVNAASIIIVVTAIAYWHDIPADNFVPRYRSLKAMVEEKTPKDSAEERSLVFEMMNY